jgi:hypothetical protein
VKITNEMVVRANSTLGMLNLSAAEVREGLEAVLAGFEDPPFVLGADESYVHALAGRRELDCDQGMVLSGALDRALKTLGSLPEAAPVGDLLTAVGVELDSAMNAALGRARDETDCDAEPSEWDDGYQTAVEHMFVDLRPIAARLPKPAPVVKTNEELSHTAYYGLTSDRREAIDELVRRANKAPK